MFKKTLRSRGMNRARNGGRAEKFGADAILAVASQLLDHLSWAVQRPSPRQLENPLSCHVSGPQKKLFD